MSNAQIIAATTATLRKLLLDEVPHRDAAITTISVTTTPLDRVGSDLSQPQINLFLYHAVLNGAWRNRDVPTGVGPNDLAQPRLGLNLHYLVTAYGPVDSDRGDFSHRVLGAAVSVLHDHPVLGPTEVVDALAQDKAQPQVERIRITPLPMTLEEISKLWTAFQTNYRVSTAYEVDVVIIESDRARRAALPVLRRGAADGGPSVVASASPWLSGAAPPTGQAAVRLGQPLRLEGGQLGSDGLVVRISGSLLSPAVELTPVERSPDHLIVQLPDLASAGAMTSWAPGFYTAAVVVRQPNLPTWTSNEVAFAVAPTITRAPAAAPAGALTIAVTCAPRPRPGQRTQLLFADQQIAPGPITVPADPTQPAQVSFDVVGSAGKSYVLRLRVDGVDSIPLGAPGVGPPVFDPQQTVTFA